MSRFRMPAEWEPQAAIWATWPDNSKTWPENRVKAQIEFSALVHSLAQFVPVHVMVNQVSLGVARRYLIQPDTFNIHLIDIPTNDAWARDYAPTFVVDRDSHSLVALDWQFNAWGGKYSPFDLDALVATRIAQGQQIERVELGLCFEGGAIETNGAGIILSTTSCGLDDNRNPSLPREERLAQFETVFNKYLGAQNTVWLPGAAIEGDDTDGHIDQLARFVGETTIVCACSEHTNDPQHAKLEQNRIALETELAKVDPGTEFELIGLPVPASFEHGGRRIPASYCNFVITNELVVVPQFSVPEDLAALSILRSLFSNRHVIGLPSRNLSVGLGSFHCLTQQVPALTNDD
ncbi:MAG: agmatine deiminase family protein [Planctomycetota bacterium]